MAVNWKGFVMENTNTTNVDTLTEMSTETTHVDTTESDNKNATEDMVTMSKTEYDKAIQAAEDRVRTKYSKNIKALEERVAELTPAKKSDEEVELEKRLANIEQKERENEAREKVLNLKTSLQSHNIDVALADYLSPDADIDAFSADIEKLVTARLVSSGYKPSGHQTNQPISKEDYNKMSYDEKVNLFKTDHASWERFRN